MHNVMRRLHSRERQDQEQSQRRADRRRTSGTVLNRFRLNELVSQVAFGGRRGRVYREIVTLAGVEPGDAVLDVGCSSGYLARKLAAAAGPDGRVTGVDPSEAAIAHANQRAAGTITFTVGVAQRLELPDEAFDTVTCTLALHHVPARQRSAALAEMYRVTKPLMRHPGSKKTQRAVATVGPLEDLASAAGYRIESTGSLPLLRYVQATRPED
jgi:SAM-dependent methyltransferase